MRSLYYFAHTGMEDPIWRIIADTAEGHFGSTVFGTWKGERGVCIRMT